MAAMNPQLLDPFETMRRLTTCGNPIIFDVGAYDGYTTWKFRKTFPSATIVSFEPHKESFQKLQFNLSIKLGDDPGIHLINTGLCDRVGHFPLHCNKSPATNSMLPTDCNCSKGWGDDNCDTKEIIDCEFITLDSAIDRIGLPRIDILKMDVQGAEPLVMKGASECLRYGKIKLVYCEFIVCQTYEGQMRLDKALSVYFDAGLILYNIFNIHLSGDGKLRQFEAIFTVNQ
jgi:FkbM family methyltransferase